MFGPIYACTIVTELNLSGFGTHTDYNLPTRLSSPLPNSDRSPGPIPKLSPLNRPVRQALHPQQPPQPIIKARRSRLGPPAPAPPAVPLRYTPNINRLLQRTQDIPRRHNDQLRRRPRINPRLQQAPDPRETWRRVEDLFCMSTRLTLLGLEGQRRGRVGLP